MIQGKLLPPLLRRLVYPHLPSRPDVLVAAAVGEDSAILDFGSSVCVATSDPITGAVQHLGRLAVHVACNDIAATGAEPVALLLTVLLPASAVEAEIEAIMREAGKAASRLGVAIAGGHTEVTVRVTHPVVVVAGIGRAAAHGYVHAGGARPGEALLLTKAAAIEGTAILATDLAAELAARVPAEVLERARRFIEDVSVVPEGRIALGAGATAMHDVTEGGVITAVWEMAEASRCGVDLWADAVPVRAETAALCAEVGADPLVLIGSGAMLIATASPQRTLAALREAGIAAVQIGEMRDDGRTLRRGASTEPLSPPERDELWRILEQRR
ncbi:MAG TPA: AIR synthase family protein [bacterium]|jgi:hydrogenase maturation factor|nr:AIR synthase family protein [bacterium]